MRKLSCKNTIYLKFEQYLHWPMHIYVGKKRLPYSSKKFCIKSQNLLFHSWRTLSQKQMNNNKNITNAERNTDANLSLKMAN